VLSIVQGIAKVSRVVLGVAINPQCSSSKLIILKKINIEAIIKQISFSKLIVIIDGSMCIKQN
jgi:hypothetical protein